MKREELVPGEDCQWYSTGPTESKIMWLCAYHAFGCPPASDFADSELRCEECEEYATACKNGCPSRHQDACDRWFTVQGYEADVGSGWHCQCMCHESYPMNKTPREPIPKERSCHDLKPSYVHFNEMVWPAIDEGMGEVEWRLRYGEPTREDLLFVASVLVAYKFLVCVDSQKHNRICAKLKERKV